MKVKEVNHEKGDVHLKDLPRRGHFAILVHKETYHWDGGERETLHTVCSYEWYEDKYAMEERLLELHDLKVQAYAVYVCDVYEVTSTVTVARAE